MYYIEKIGHFGTRASARLCGMLICFAAVANVQADTLLGVYAGAGTWQQEFRGEMTSSVSTIDVEDDLALQEDSSSIFYLALEHGLPILPNIRAQHFSLDVDGHNVLSRDIEFNGDVFALSDDVTTTVDLTQSDAVLYYEVLDNVVSLDLGLAVAMVEGSIAMASTTESAFAEFDEFVPMLYAKARADLPLTGLWVGVEAQGAGYSGSSLLEYNAQVGWESQLGLGIEAGWRAVQIELDEFDDMESAQLDIDGPYAAINFHF